MPPFAMLCALVGSVAARRRLDQDFVTAIDWRKVDWPRLVRLSGVHLLTPALAPALADEAIREHVPEELADYLAAMLEGAQQRNLALRQELEQIAACLSEVDVVPVVLKGGIRLVDRLWPDPALRFMNDLDLLVPESAVWACVARLAESGWRPFDEQRQDLAQHVILLHPEQIARVELHRRPLPEGYGDLLPAARMLTRATPTRLGEMMVAIPALEDQLVHLVAHGMLQHAFLRNGRFVLRDIIELALLSARADGRELDAARARFAATGHALAWDVSLELCARCCDGDPTAESWTARLLATRMMLQQRSPWAMQLLGACGWLAAQLAATPLERPIPMSARELVSRVRGFRRKTLW